MAAHSNKRRRSVNDTYVRCKGKNTVKTPNKPKSIASKKKSKKQLHSPEFYQLNADKVGKFKVENSWGDVGDENGFYTMTREWFTMFGYEIVINKKHLSDEQLKILKTKPIIVKDSDPLGRPAGKD
jgi:hypothetical protein